MDKEALNLNYYYRCIATLQLAYQKYIDSDQISIENQLFRSACVKEFEIIVECTASEEKA
ncbi:MAG TPA: hypothetical protein PKD85_04865 [Saprospiraceae bacterium]|nr:hypothetical protein [Saprospiraceae bacterium]